MTTSITLAPELEARLEALAAETRRDKGYFLHEIVERGLEDVGDCYLAIEALGRVRKGEEKIHPAAEVRQELGLEDRVQRDRDKSASPARSPNRQTHS